MKDTLRTSTCGFCGYLIYWETVYKVWRHYQSRQIGPVACDLMTHKSAHVGCVATPTVMYHGNSSVTRSMPR